MNVLSLFDGISPFRIASDNIGLPTGWYYSLETNRHLSKISFNHFPNSIRFCDISDINYKLLPQIDLIVGSVNNQNSMYAGNMLFFEFYYLYEKLKEINPALKFLFHINKFIKAGIDISKYLQLEPLKAHNKLCITSEFSYYWINWDASIKTTDGITVVDNIKKLPISICEALKSIPENFTCGVTDKYRYLAIENSMDISILSQLLSFL